MIEENLFRPLPRPTQQNFNPEEDEPFLDPEFEHIGMFKSGHHLVGYFVV